MDRPALSQWMKKEQIKGGLLSCGAQKTGSVMVSTMAWSPVLLTLLAHYTGDWMWGQGKGPWEDTWALLPPSCVQTLDLPCL